MKIYIKFNFIMLMSLVIAGCSGPMVPAPASVLRDSCLKAGPVNSTDYANCVADSEAIKKEALDDLLSDRPTHVVALATDAPFEDIDYPDTQAPMVYRTRGPISATELRALPFKASIRWKYVTKKILPEPRDRIRMDEMERLVIQAVEEKAQAKLMCTVTGNNQREWIFYAKNNNDFIALVGAALANSAPYPIQISAHNATFFDTQSNVRRTPAGDIIFTPKNCLE